jgi:cellulose synthase/poly-beta-1,6-N-acetylglucosamine synthase-like glycosyltransferase
MSNLAEIVFIASLALIFYACAGYPVLAFVLGRLRGREVRKADITPSVSVIIAAHNEERDIAAKIERTLALDYPKGKVEIIVASDASTDRTDDIARSYSSLGVTLHRQPERLGKTMAQNSAVEVASGEVIVFTDATTAYESDMLRKIVRSFADPEVGCVSSHVVYVDMSKTTVGRGCRSYWGYEKFIQQSESRLGSMIGVTGCLYAVRRSSYTRLAHDMCSDFVIASETRLKGLRTVYEREAVSIEDTNKRSRDEFRMRVRIMEQTMISLSRYREVLNLRRHGLFAFQMLSHKVLRYAVAALLVVAFASNLLLVGDSKFYQITMAAQSTFYFAALVGWLFERAGVRLGALALPYYFVLANVATVVAFVKFMRGEVGVVWDPLREAGPSGGDDAGRA